MIRWQYHCKNAHKNKTTSGFYTDTIIPCLCGFSKTSMPVVVAGGFILVKDSVWKAENIQMDYLCLVLLIIVVRCVLAIWYFLSIKLQWYFEMSFWNCIHLCLCAHQHWRRSFPSGPQMFLLYFLQWWSHSHRWALDPKMFFFFFLTF